MPGNLGTKGFSKMTKSSSTALLLPKTASNIIYNQLTRKTGGVYYILLPHVTPRDLCKASSHQAACLCSRSMIPAGGSFLRSEMPGRSGGQKRTAACGGGLRRRRSHLVLGHLAEGVLLAGGQKRAGRQRFGPCSPNSTKAAVGSPKSNPKTARG